MIHTITAYASSEVRPLDGGRTFGYFPTRPAAEDAVLANECDMHECLYTHIVIEAVRPGIHALAEDEAWFVWDGKRWCLCGQPEWARSVINHSMG